MHIHAPSWISNAFRFLSSGVSAGHAWASCHGMSEISPATAKAPAAIDAFSSLLATSSAKHATMLANAAHTMHEIMNSRFLRAGVMST